MQPFPATSATERGSSQAPDTRLTIRRVSSPLSHAPQTLVRLAGELDADTSSSLREELAGLVTASAGRRLVLDLSGVTYCDRASLYTLVGIRHGLSVGGVETVLTRASAAVRSAMGVAGLGSRLPLH